MRAAFWPPFNSGLNITSVDLVTFAVTLSYNMVLTMN